MSALRAKFGDIRAHKKIKKLGPVRRGPYDRARTSDIPMEVVNDSAERGVKLISDFKDVTRDIEQQHYLLQVVEAHRQELNSLKKTDLINL